MKKIGIIAGFGTLVLVSISEPVMATTAQTLRQNPSTLVTKPSSTQQNTRFKSTPVAILPTKQYRTKLPVAKINVEYSVVIAGLPPTIPKFVFADVPHSLKDKWAAYCAYLGGNHFLYIDVPKSVKPVKPDGNHNVVGADGGFELLLKGPGVTLEVSSSGPCGGCSQSEAAPYFSNANTEQRQETNVSIESAQQLGENVSYRNKNLALFSYEDKVSENVTYGFNQYDPEQNWRLHPYGIDFDAQYTVHGAAVVAAPWVLVNLIEQTMD